MVQKERFDQTQPGPEGRYYEEWLPEWTELTQQEQQGLLGQLEDLLLQVEPDLDGLQRLVNREYEIHSQVQSLKQRIEKLGRERLQEKIKIEQVQPDGVQEPTKPISRRFKARSRITSLKELDSMIQELQKLKIELRFAHAFELDVQVEN